MDYNLISYAMDFASFIIQKLKDEDKIRNIILFGSVSRGESTKDSDIDIFIDVSREDEKIKKELKEIQIDFFNSAKYKQYWKLLGIENDITLIIAELKKWKEIKPSIIANGIVLYGKFKSEIKEGEHKTFFIWENIYPNSKRVLFNKQIFGYKQNKKEYSGLLNKYSGERLGKGCIIVPLENSIIFHNLFKKYKITVKMKKVLVY